MIPSRPPVDIKLLYSSTIRWLWNKPSFHICLYCRVNNNMKISNFCSTELLCSCFCYLLSSLFAPGPGERADRADRGSEWEDPGAGGSPGPQDQAAGRIWRQAPPGTQIYHTGWPRMNTMPVIFDFNTIIGKMSLLFISLGRKFFYK